MASTEASGLTVRTLVEADLEAALALSREAGWNQTAADWQAMLASGVGTAVADPAGVVVATGLVLPYGGRFGWIAMILVTGARRRQGIATMLLRRAMAQCAERGLVAGLDATEAGRPVYLPLGFRDVYPLSRMIARQPAMQPAAGTAVRPMTELDLPAVAAYDRGVFGADRGAVLGHLFRRWRQAAWVAAAEGAVRGFCLGRDGRTAHQIGPLSAADEATGLALLRTAVAAAGGPVLIDLADRHAGLRAALEAAGFTRQRGYVRMLLDRAEPLDDPAQVYAIAGPEIG